MTSKLVGTRDYLVQSPAFQGGDKMLFSSYRGSSWSPQILIHSNKGEGIEDLMADET